MNRVDLRDILGEAQLATVKRTLKQSARQSEQIQEILSDLERGVTTFETSQAVFVLEQTRVLEV